MSKRLKRHGSTVQIVEFRCPRCQRSIIASQGEATPPKPGLVPYCQDCLRQGHPVQLVRRLYRSGPTDLIV